ncbi:MAG: hypothetical protein ACJ79H_18920 [Myxococcales bacterium]
MSAEAFQMQVEGPSAGPAATGAAEVRCGGFHVVFDDGAPSVRLVPGERRLSPAMTAAVLQGLSEAPALLADALRVHAPARPYDVVEVTLAPGELTHGEASSLGTGCIRLSLGESTPVERAASIARHEALHLLLASSLRGGERWNDPELAFADWIVRGIESGRDPRLPRFHAPLPQLLTPVARSRVDVQQQLAAVASAPGAARRYFGEPLFAELQRLDSQSDRAAVEQRQLWVVEAALGTHYLETAGRLHVEEGDGLIPVVLDDWLADYEEYSRAVASPPSGAGNLWRLSESGWSRDPLTRLSVAAQALQADDHCHFSGDRFTHAGEPVVWKNRGRIRLPLRAREPRPRPAPIHGFRAVLREVDAPQATALVEQAARGGAHLFEARVLWPRILARLLAADLPATATQPAPAPLVQLVDSGDGSADRIAFEEWEAAAASLRRLSRGHAVHVPRIAEPQDAATLADMPRPSPSVQLVHAVPATATALLAARSLAARRAVRGALFRDHLDAGKPYELLPDLDAPLDPRYRDDVWLSGSPLPERLEDLPGLVDEATKEGRLTTPVSHLLAMVAIGLEECHYPRPR